MTALTQGGFFLWTLYPRMAAVTFATLTSVQHLIILISVFFFGENKQRIGCYKHTSRTAMKYELMHFHQKMLEQASCAKCRISNRELTRCRCRYCEDPGDESQARQSSDVRLHGFHGRCCRGSLEKLNV